MHRYTDEDGLQMVLDLDDRDRLTGIRAVAALTTVELGAVAWVIAFQQMNGMDTMRATGPGSFASFISLWVLMMAAMMLPGAAPQSSDTRTPAIRCAASCAASDLESSSGSTASARTSD